MPDGFSQAEELARLPEEERRAFLDNLTADEQRRLLYTWSFWARPKQRIPDGDWYLWAILAGRFFGKTRSAAEAIRHLVCTGQAERILFAGPTAGDVRDVMVEGESGILRVFPPEQEPKYYPGKRRIDFHTGAYALLRSAEAEKRLRGPQYDTAWLDEFAVWPDMDMAWKLLVPSIRLRTPRIIMTTTPVEHPRLHWLLERETTVYTQGTSYENAGNIPDETLREVTDLYEGTDFGQQEIYGLLTGRVPGALWRRAWLDDHRVAKAPELRRLIVAIDPSSSKSKEACECGIVVCGLGTDGKGYILEDLSLKATAEEWVRIALKARDEHKASQIVFEGNHGGGYILDVFRLVDRESLKWLKGVQAVTDKEKRATPIAAMTQKGMVRMVGTHAKLEEQLTTWSPRSGKSPDRLDAMVWGMHEFFIRPEVPRGTLSIPGFW